jgi:PIN domain nuclease of toxin-antitoxin system
MNPNNLILLDTHIWLWWLLGDGNLTPRERDLLDTAAANRELCISWVSVWETEMLERKECILLEPGFESWIRDATDPSYILVLPADTEVVIAQRLLPDNFHADPADRLITATSILSGYPLATHDRRIAESEACAIWSPRY